MDGSTTVKPDELPPFGFQVRKRVGMLAMTLAGILAEQEFRS